MERKETPRSKGQWVMQRNRWGCINCTPKSSRKVQYDIACGRRPTSIGNPDHRYLDSWRGDEQKFNEKQSKRASLRMRRSNSDLGQTKLQEIHKRRFSDSATEEINLPYPISKEALESNEKTEYFDVFALDALERSSSKKEKIETEKHLAAKLQINKANTRHKSSHHGDSKSQQIASSESQYSCQAVIYRLNGKLDITNANPEAFRPRNWDGTLQLFYRKEGKSETKHFRVCIMPDETWPRLKQHITLEGVKIAKLIRWHKVNCPLPIPETVLCALALESQVQEKTRNDLTTGIIDMIIAIIWAIRNVRTVQIEEFAEKKLTSIIDIWGGP